MNQMVDVSQNFVWYSATEQFEDRRTGQLLNDSAFVGKLAVFEDRVKTWFLDVALQECGPKPSQGDYVALSVALAYVEGIEHYRRGASAPSGRARTWFLSSARRVLKNAEDRALQELWRSVRCGLFHSGFTEGPTLLTRDRDESLWVVDSTLHINPRSFVESAVSDFNDYVDCIRSAEDSELARNFTTLWDERWART